ncbi:MAG: hypothetical protein K6T91_09405 [Firmicutes bacterium]|nr:hypothetical protein [Bacillota bacterium]
MKESGLGLSGFSNKKHRYVTAAIIIFLFIISILVRMTYLNRPLSDHHEWLTSTVLIHERIWYEQGGLKYKFCPPLTFENKADKNIPNAASNHKDQSGNYYYTSYPPFAYVLPYLIFRLLNIYPSALPLQIFNLFFHFVSAIFVFLIVVLLTKERYQGRLNTPAIIGYALYVFAPATMWYQSNVYMADMFVQSLFIIEIYVFLKLIADENRKPIYLVFLGLVNFLAIYTEWLGLLLAFTISLYALFNIKHKEMKVVLYVVAATTIASLTLLVWQYAQIDGLNAFIQASARKYVERSGVSKSTNLNYWSLASWEAIASNYIYGYLPLLVLLFSFAVLYFYKVTRSLTPKVFSEKRIKVALYLSIVPVVLHHLIFFNFTANHDFSALKSSVAIVILIALLYQSLVTYFQMNGLKGHKSLSALAVSGLVILMAIGSVMQYLVVNRQWSSQYMNIGRTIANTSEKDEVIFLNEEFILPQIVLYAHRNIASWVNEEHAKELIKLNGAKQGVLFILSPDDKQVVRKKYINVD